ncbi:MAG TPA: response regulator [Thermoanaerobaculia bacterium]|jgi:DNA-binding response OmpR family regulator|nr:response regulator [Thermoanaerobaculia bacterium]
MTNSDLPEKTRLLVLDDEAVLREAISRFFVMRGYDVDVASELEEAEALIAASTAAYAAVIVDLRLTAGAGAEGLEFLRFVRERSRSTAVVVLSAYGSTEIEERARELGCEAFLSKPRPLDEIADVIRNLLERK